MLPDDLAPPYSTIVFDCDSTLSAIEGIDELGAPETRDQVVELTERAMRGELALEEVFGRRLELVQPSRAALERITASYIERALTNVQACISLLRRMEKRLVIVSGGLLPAVEGFGQWLGIEEVHAVPISFDKAGGFASFSAQHPLANTGGKIEVIASLAAQPGARPMALVGDGATDLEAAGEVQRFIAFGGVVRRENVFAGARITNSSSNFADLLPQLLSPSEIDAAREWPEFVELLASFN